MTVIEQIKAEIERRITDNTFGAKLELIDILAWLDTLESEKPIPKDLEEAAKEYAYTGIPDEMKYIVKPVAEQIIKNFIAGAKWQKEQDGKNFSEKIAAAYQLGLADKESQMMREAVKGEIKDFHFIHEINYASAKIEFNSIPKLKEGDKVYIITAKEN